MVYYRIDEGGSAMADQRILVPGADVQSLIDALPSYAMLLDENHRILAANSAVATAFSVKPEDLVGKYCPSAIHGLDHPFPGCPMEEAVETNGPVSRELFDEASGRWVLSQIFPTALKSEGGGTIYLHLVQDITERKRTEAELEKKSDIQSVVNTMLRSSLEDVSLDSMLHLTLDLLTSLPWLTFESRGAIFIADEQERALLMRVHKGLSEEIVKACRRIPYGRCMCGRAAESGEIEFVDKLDEMHEITYEGITPHGHYCVPIRAGDRVLGVINLYLREGHRREPWEAEFLAAVANALAGIIQHTRSEETRARLTAIIEATSDLVGIAGTDQRVLFVNGPGRRMMGIPEDEDITGIEIREFHPGWAYQTVASKGIPAAVRDGVWSGETALQTRDGREIPVSQVITAHKKPDGSIDYMSTILRDVTENRRLQAQFVHAQKMDAVGRLAGGVAHDFNNLLSVIISYSSSILEELPVGSELRADAEEIRKAGLRAAALTRQLLAFSRKQTVEPRDVNVQDAIGELSKMLVRLVGEHIDLKISAGGAPRVIRIDPVQLEQVLVNLAINARDAMPHGGALTIAVRTVLVDREQASLPAGIECGEYVQIGVEDTGVGMSQEIMQKIFEPFFTTKLDGKGTGLGLSMVYGAVKQNGGHISVSSEPGRGTTFTVWFKRVEPKAAAASDAAAEIPRGKGETILLVEDDESARRATARMLTAGGYRIIEARNGVEALTSFKANQGSVSMVISDVVMPSMGGGELEARLREMDPATKILFVSGYLDDMVRAQGVIGAGAAVLGKPFERGLLLRSVRMLLDRNVG
ncbi:MAG: ATP-binding protein [Acidobacteriota bacterium]